MNTIIFNLINNFNSITPTSDIGDLVNKVLSIVMPIVMVVAFAIGVVFTAITFIGGYNDLTGIERKQRIKRLLWIWFCCAGVFATSTIMLCLRTYFEKLVN